MNTQTSTTAVHVADLDERVRTGDLPGYGVRWDGRAFVYRVRNEITGRWALGPGGVVMGWPTFEGANAAHRMHQPATRRPGW